MRTRALALIVTVAASSLAFGNSGNLLPLDQYQAGTESTNNTIVQNRGFESLTAGSPDSWTNAAGPAGVGSPGVAAPIGPNVTPSVHQNQAASYPGTTSAQRHIWEQVVTVTPNTDYVLSGYLWNYSGDGGDSVVLEARSVPTIPLNTSFLKNVALVGGSNGGTGFFGYDSFNSGSNTSIAVQALYNFNTAAGGTFPGTIGQIDNVSLTPASSFVAPSVIPEPASLSLVAGLAVALRRSRR